MPHQKLNRAGNNAKIKYQCTNRCWSRLGEFSLVLHLPCSWHFTHCKVNVRSFSIVNARYSGRGTPKIAGQTTNQKSVDIKRVNSSVPWSKWSIGSEISCLHLSFFGNRSSCDPWQHANKRKKLPSYACHATPQLNRQQLTCWSATQHLNWTWQA